MICNGFYVSLRKTNKINVDENAHRLPPNRGQFEEFKVADYYCPDEWSKDGVFVKIEEEEPFWVDFTHHNQECAVLVSIQKLNPVTGEPADLESGLSKDPVQNYLRLPEQMWLDGYANEGKVYQFTGTKAGESLAVNEFVLPKHMQDSHALGFAFFGPKNPKPRPTAPVWTPPVFKKSSIGPPETPYYSDKVGILYDSCLGACACDDIDHAEQLTSGGILRGFAMEAGMDVEAGVDELDRFSEPDTVNLLEQIEEESLDKASVAAGGRIDQKIVPDSNTVDYYHEKPSAQLVIYLALPGQFESIMKKGKRQDSKKKDKYVFSGKIGGIQVPLAK